MALPYPNQLRSRLFKVASTQSLVASAAWPVTAYPFSMACWFKPVSHVNGSLIGLGSDAPSDGYVFLHTRSTGQVRAQNDDGAISANAVSAGSARLGEWNHAVGIWESSTSRKIYLNYNDTATNTTSVAFASRTGLNTVSIGALGGLRANLSLPNPNNFANSEIALPAIWADVLSDAEVSALFSGALPQQIRRRGLRYQPDLVNLGVSDGAMSNIVLVDANGSLPWSSLDRITVKSQRKTFYVATAPATFRAAWASQANSVVSQGAANAS